MRTQPLHINNFFRDDLFANRTVFVTGGGSGINLGIAKNFAAVGANIGICGRTQSRLDEARTELDALGAKVSTSVADVRDYGALEAAFAQTKDELGPIAVLVCAAAGTFFAKSEEMSANAFKSVVDIDLLGSFNASRAAFEQLKETQGSILFISAGQSLIPYPGQAHTGAAKAGIDNLMKNLAMEWGPYGIRSNSIVPGPIEGTEGMRRLAPDAIKEKLQAIMPLGRFGTTDDIGEVAVFLSSPMASFVTGTTVIVDGGQNLPGAGIFAQVVQRAMS